MQYGEIVDSDCENHLTSNDVEDVRRGCAVGGVRTRPAAREERTIVTHSTWINAEDLLRERTVLRTELARLRAENERLRGALVEEVYSEVQHASKHAPAEACASSNGC
jgi:hypothetical protein